MTWPIATAAVIALLALAVLVAWGERRKADLRRQLRQSLRDRRRRATWERWLRRRAP